MSFTKETRPTSIKRTNNKEVIRNTDLSRDSEKNLNRAKQQTRKDERCIRLGTTNGDSADIADICRVVGSNLRERYSKKRKYVIFVHLRVYVQKISIIFLGSKFCTDSWYLRNFLLPRKPMGYRGVMITLTH